MHKFGTWLNEWMLSGKKGLSKQTFTSCFQTSQSFPLLIQHLLEIKGFDYILTGNNQSDPPEKCFGRYRQLSDANYSGSEKVFRCRKINESSLSSNFWVYNERGRQHNGK